MGADADDNFWPQGMGTSAMTANIIQHRFGYGRVARSRRAILKFVNSPQNPTRIASNPWKMGRMLRETKSVVVKDVGALVKDAAVIVRTDFKGVNVEDMTNLRREIRNANGKYRVVKNTLAKIAFVEPGMDNFRGGFDGPSGFAFGFEHVQQIGAVNFDEVLLATARNDAGGIDAAATDALSVFDLEVLRSRL